MSIKFEGNGKTAFETNVTNFKKDILADKPDILIKAQLDDYANFKPAREALDIAVTEVKASWDEYQNGDEKPALAGITASIASVNELLEKASEYKHNKTEAVSLNHAKSVVDKMQTALADEDDKLKAEQEKITVEQDKVDAEQEHSAEEQKKLSDIANGEGYLAQAVKYVVLEQNPPSADAKRELLQFFAESGDVAHIKDNGIITWQSDDKETVFNVKVSEFRQSVLDGSDNIIKTQLGDYAEFKAAKAGFDAEIDKVKKVFDGYKRSEDGSISELGVSTLGNSLENANSFLEQAASLAHIKSENKDLISKQVMLSKLETKFEGEKSKTEKDVAEQNARKEILANAAEPKD